jgi:hypothetical protein
MLGHDLGSASRTGREMRVAVHTVVELVLGCLLLAYYGFKILRRLFDDFGNIVTSWLQRRSRSHIEIRTNDDTTVVLNDLSVAEIERVLRQAESRPPQEPKSEREEENPSD